MNPGKVFVLLTLGTALSLCVIGLLPALTIVLVICVISCCLMNRFDSFKSRHVVSPEERPSDEDGWTHLMRNRGLYHHRKHTFIVEPSHVVEHQFKHYSGDIYISDGKLNVVHLERNYFARNHHIVYDGRALVKVNVDTNTHPVHFVDFERTMVSVIAALIYGNSNICSTDCLGYRKANIKNPNYWPLGRESPDDLQLILTKDQKCGAIYANSPVMGLSQIGSKTQAHRLVWVPYVLSEVLLRIYCS